jgi:hypothetical protein
MSCNFNSVKIIKGGDISGDEKATGSLTGTLSYYSFGGVSDLWGETWAADDINSADFGVVVSFAGSVNISDFVSHYLKATDFGFSIPSGATINGIVAEVKANYAGTTVLNAQVDHVRITVYYTVGGISAVGAALLSLV